MALDISPKQTYVTKQKRKNIYHGFVAIFLLFLIFGITIYILVNLSKYTLIVLIADAFLCFSLVIANVYLRNQDKIINSWHKGEKGEAITKSVITSLPSTYTCFEDVHLPEISGNIDHIVVGPNGIFSIETKNIKPIGYGWRKQFSLEQYEAICNQTYRQAMDLQRFLNKHNINVDLVIPLLALAHPHYKAAKQTWFFKGVRVVPAHLLSEYVTNLKNCQLSWEKSGQIIEKLASISPKRVIT